MNRLERLPEITEQALGSLRADGMLKQRILEGSVLLRPVRSSRLIPAVCCLAVILIGTVIGIGTWRSQQPSLPEHTFSAATHTASSPVLLQNFLMGNLE